MATSKISELAQQTSLGTNWTIRLIKTTGVVTYLEPRFLFLQNQTDGLRVFLRSEAAVQIGDRIEAVGFAEPDGFCPKLVQALVRRIGDDPLPVPTYLNLMRGDLSDQ